MTPRCSLHAMFCLVLCVGMGRLALGDETLTATWDNGKAESTRSTVGGITTVTDKVTNNETNYNYEFLVAGRSREGVAQWSRRGKYKINVVEHPGQDCSFKIRRNLDRLIMLSIFNNSEADATFIEQTGREVEVAAGDSQFFFAFATDEDTIEEVQQVYKITLNLGCGLQEQTSLRAHYWRVRR